MKQLQIIAACLVMLVLGSVSCVKPDGPVHPASPSNIRGHAIARTIHGAATYTTSGGTTRSLKANVLLNPGDTITTGPDSFVYLSVNGLSSALRVASDTTLVIDRMEYTGTARGGSQVTKLDLKLGSIMGQVKKLAADSKYEIATPHGMAGIRGTDYAVDVVSNKVGQYTVTFTSITGTVVASADVKGQLQTKTLNGGETWTVGRDVVPMEINLTNICPGIGRGIILLPQLNPAIVPTPVTVLPVFPNGAAPLGPSRAPRR